VKHLGKGRAHNIQEAQTILGSNSLCDDVWHWLSGYKKGNHIYGGVLVAYAEELGIKNMVLDIQNGLNAQMSLLEDLVDAGVEILSDVMDTPVTNGRLSGQSFCFTQVRMTEDEKARLKALGGEEKSGVSGGLTYLVTKNPDKATTKSDKAKELGTQVISYEQFQKLIL